MENSFDVTSEVCDRIGFAKSLYLKDLSAMPDDLLGKAWGPKTRTAYDVTFELAGMYSTFAELLNSKKGEVTGPAGWVRAPKDFQSREKSMSSLGGAFDNFLSAFRAYKGNIHSDKYPSPAGPMTPLGMANLAVSHTMYHSGQLNYIQTLAGDDAFHWF